MVDSHHRRVTIPPKLWESLTYHVHDEKLKVPEELRESITNESVICGVLRKRLVESGHYPPKNSS